MCVLIMISERMSLSPHQRHFDRFRLT